MFVCLFDFFLFRRSVNEDRLPSIAVNCGQQTRQQQNGVNNLAFVTDGQDGNIRRNTDNSGVTVKWTY